MENQKNNRRLIILLIIIVILLGGLCILLATGTISFKDEKIENNNKDKVHEEDKKDDAESKDKDKVHEEDKNDDVESKDKDKVHEEDKNDDVESIAKEKMPIAISFINQNENIYIYCGNFDIKDEITIDSKPENLYMTASEKFATFEQLKKYLNDNLSDEIINKYLSTNKNNYLEKNGKLYCKRHPRADGDNLGFTFMSERSVNNDNITYTILNKQQNSFNVMVEIKHSYSENQELNEERKLIINATLSKVNDNWVVSKYKQEEK